MHSGYGAETGEKDCFGADFEKRIWAHAYAFPEDTWVSKDKWTKLGGYTVASAHFGNCGRRIAKIGTYAYKVFHHRQFIKKTRIPHKSSFICFLFFVLG